MKDLIHRFCLLASLSPLTACVEPPLSSAPDAAAPSNVPDGTVGTFRARTFDGETTLTYVVDHGHAIVEGDLDLGPVATLLELRGGAVNLDQRWPGGVLYFAFDSGFTGSVCGKGMVGCVDVRARVRDTLASMAAQTPLTFVETTTSAPNVVIYKWADHDAPGAGNTDHVGMETAALSDGSVHIAFRSGHDDDPSGPALPYALEPSSGTITHETLHAAGFWHEQSRSDRDQFISVHDGCMIQDQQTKHQFDVHDDFAPVGPYDYVSVMHYSKDAFCQKKAIANADGTFSCECDVMTPNLEGAKIAPTGNLSVEDVNTLYRTYTQNPNNADTNEAYGRALAVGDFDLDGYDDLAVGVPNDTRYSISGTTITPHPSAGSVILYKGTSAGLVYWLTLDEASATGYTDNGHFGAALAALDLNGDGRMDLAIGEPQGNGGAGIVYTYFGRKNQRPLYDREITQSLAGAGTDEVGDRFGEALAGGAIIGTKDLVCANGKTCGDALVVGAPGDRNTAVVGHTTMSTRSGAVYVFEEQRNTDNTSSLAAPTRIAHGPLNATDSDAFGAALAVGDLDGDGHADVAVGAPHEQSNAGVVRVYAGHVPTGAPSAWGSLVTAGGSVTGPAGSFAGSALAIGNVYATAGVELVIGRPASGAGGSVAVYSGGLSPVLATTLSDPKAAAAPDHFGAALAIGNIEHAGPGDDLVIGEPGANSNAGAIFVAPGGTLSPAKKITQADLAGDVKTGDLFGASLAIGQLDGMGAVPTSASVAGRLLDLAIGAPGEAPEVVSPPSPGAAGAGAVNLMHGGSAGSLTPWTTLAATYTGRL